MMEKAFPGKEWNHQHLGLGTFQEVSAGGIPEPFDMLWKTRTANISKIIMENVS